MPNAPIAPVAAPTPRPAREFASWGQRVHASTIDGALLLIPTIVLLAIALPLLLGAQFDEVARLWDLLRFESLNEEQINEVVKEMARTLAVIILVAIALGTLLSGLYHSIFLAKTGGRSPGRRAAGIRVVPVDGRELTPSWCVWRALFVQRLLPLPLLLLTGGALQVVQYLWPLWDDQRRALHDVFAHSRVVVEGDATR